MKRWTAAVLAAAAAVGVVPAAAHAQTERFVSERQSASGAWSFEVRGVPAWRVTGATVRAGGRDRVLSKRTIRALLAKRGQRVRVRVPGARHARRAVLNVQLAPANTARPGLDGIPVVGQTLTCHLGAWLHSEQLQMQWLRDFRPLYGHTGPHYTLTADDQGNAVACRVTAQTGALQVPVLSPPMVVYGNDRPYLMVSGNTVSWLPVGDAQSYVYSYWFDGDRKNNPQYGKVTGTSMALPVSPGHTITFGLRADVKGAKWAEEVDVTF